MMHTQVNKFVPLQKQSKKRQQEFYSKDRGSWLGVNPVTKITPNKKLYNRKKQSKNFDCFVLLNR